MADSLLVPIHVEALFVPGGQEKKQSGVNARPVHEQRLELPPGIHLHWYLPHALTRGQNGWCRVNTVALNVRREPDPNAQIIGWLQVNMLVKPVEKNADGSWIRILHPSDNLTGWYSAH